MISKALWLNTGGNPTFSMTYDGYGNQKTLTDPRGHTTTTDYDTATYTYPAKVTAPQTSDGLTHIVEYGYDYRFGTVSSKKDERGFTTSNTYDVFGRLSQVDFPDGGQQIITYSDALPPNRYNRTKVKETSGSTVDTYQYFDGLDRKIAVVTFGESEQIDSTTSYDTMGRIYRTEGPYFPSWPQSARPYAQTAYDYRGRPIKVTSPDITGTMNTIYEYTGFATTITDPDSKKKTENRDYLGRIIQVTEYADTSTQNTTYTYNAAGDLLQIKDPLNNTITQTYDTLGRKITMNDPDLGHWQYTYDANGNLLTEANQRTLASLATEATEIDNTYDKMNRVESETKIIEGAPAAYTTQYKYDLAGKPKEQTYPDNYKVTYAYYPGSGLLYTATGADSEVYATCTLYEPTGKMGQISHGNGTATRYTYDPKSTRLTAIVTTDPSGSPANDVQRRSYTYSKAGDITKILDDARGITYNYTYDKLHRLTSETSGGVYPQISYAYNGIGNITQKTIGTDTYSYTYDTAHRHAVKTITLNGTPYNYTYDEAGNTLNGPDFTNPANIATRAIYYYADNLPATIQHTTGGVTDFVYDGLGNRVIKQASGGGITYYIGDHFELKDGIATKYIFAGNLRVAKVTPSGPNYYHKDHLSSSSAVTDDAGAVIEMTEYQPFGAERDHAGEVVSDYKFTDQELDTETGLYNYDARHYDAVIGRFISADLAVPDLTDLKSKHLYDPQMLNRYSYTRNNPLIYIDPSGKITLAIEYNSSNPYGAIAVRIFESKTPIFSRSDSGFPISVNLKSLKEFLTPTTWDRWVTRGKNASGEEVAVGGGVYQFKIEQRKNRAYFAPLLEGGKAINTLEPNSVQAGQNKADWIYIHMMNSYAKTLGKVGSEGCQGPPVAGGGWEKFIKTYERGDEGTYVLWRASPIFEKAQQIFNDIIEGQEDIEKKDDKKHSDR